MSYYGYCHQMNGSFGRSRLSVKKGRRKSGRHGCSLPEQEDWVVQRLSLLPWQGLVPSDIIDPDNIEKTNLNRQLYREIDIGRPKAETAAKAIRAVNSSIEVESVATTIGTSPVRDLIRGMDVVIDGLDNYPARYLLADAAWQCRIPFIHGAVNGFYGQVCTIVRPKSPCLRCIVPKPPPVRETPVIGVTTGITGCVQVTEAIKLATGIGTTISDQLWLWDGIRQKSDRLKIERIQTCHICGTG